MDEDQLFVGEAFADQQVGKALVIGANQGEGPAYSLIEKGWYAVCCEPDPYALGILLKNKYADQLTIVNSAITPTPGKLTPFYLAERTAMSSLQKEWLDLQVDRNVCPKDEAVQKEILTHTISFQELLDYVGNDFNLVVIDAEGVDSELLRSIDWNQLPQCHMVCVEDLGDGGRCLEVAGFKFVHKSEHNYYYTR